MQPWAHLELSYTNLSDMLLFFGRSEEAERSGARSPKESTESVYCTWLMLFDRGEHMISHVILTFCRWLTMLID
jgi:hypothetical protein